MLTFAYFIIFLISLIPWTIFGCFIIKPITDSRLNEFIKGILLLFAGPPGWLIIFLMVVEILENF